MYSSPPYTWPGPISSADFDEDNPTKGNVAKARSDNFPTGNGGSKNYGEVDSVDSGNPLTFRGTFDDVPGVFACAMGCTLLTNAKGELRGADQTWNFTPDLANAATVKVPDADYAYFGWWLDKPEKNTVAHNVEVFAGGSSDTHEVTVGVAIEGTATYAGPAAGKYVSKTFAAGVQTDAGVGHFTANADLTARFGDDAVAAVGTDEDVVAIVGGSISGFELDDGSNPDWTVKLENTNLTTGSNTNFSGTTEVDFGAGFDG